ncbi:unnamed protein product [Rangifer tarandus platyrhynchus]|uniref:Uncharacterized protein n=2 Tax=Rangifer tarandus platyrhynchus TaxID=3082113 RepID=A0ACB0E196_RANTA|nr:unnamed protein product [Rangifer tarandus platyrhynchus]CAI9694271.1 unnamed protein product [Rangifer tarandus platyrhynchus]
MSAAGLSDSDSGGRPDSCQTVPACPLPPFRKRPETSQGAAAPSPPPEPRPSGWVQGTEAARKGLKSLPNLGTGRGEGGARAPEAGGGRGSLGARAAGCAGGRAGRGYGGFPGSARPHAFLGSPVSLPSASSPSIRAGVPGPLHEGCPARSPPPTPGRRPRGGRELLIGPLAQTPCVRSPPPPLARSGRDPPVGLAHLNLDLPRGTGAASPERASSSARATAGWGERARRELQQVSLDQPSVPCPGTARICAPHRTLRGSSPPSRPAPLRARPLRARRRLRGGA